MKKKIISAVTLLSLIAALSSGCVSAKNNNIKVIYDGQTVEFDVQPEIIDDRVMVPMRTIFETFGAKVKWDGDTQTITAKRKSKTISMTIGNTDMTKNDETYSFDTAPIIEDGRTLVPIRAISDMLGLDVEWNSEDKTVEITTPTDDEDDAWKANTGTINLDTLETTGDGVTVNDNIITVSQGGDFEVTGTLLDGQIVIDSEEKVKLRLSGMSLTNKNGSAIYIKNADKAYITITENTENTLTDGESYTSGDEKEKACITSRDNLEIKGNGTLTVNGNYNHGIDGSDSMEIGNGNITINAKNDGIHVNETLEISGGTLNVTAEGDGIQADEIIDITGGSVNVTTTGEIPVSNNNFDNFGGMGGDMKDPSQMTDEERQSMREEMQKQFEAARNQEIESDSSEDVTSKGIKAGWMMDISGGEITVNATDHAIHCSSDLNIKGGKMTLYSEVKKGISAHGDIVIDDGYIDITKSTEGIESKQIMTINGGDIRVNASDDGLNAGGNGMDDMFGGGFGGGQRPDKADNQSDMDRADRNMGNGQMTPPDMMGDGQMTPPDMMGDGQMMPTEMQDGSRPDMSAGGHGGPAGPFGNSNSNEIDSEHHIQINGGTIYVNAQGDGIDSNGSLVIDGGKVIVDGPVSGGDSALDTDGALMVNGGELIAVSAMGMVEAPNSYSTQNVLNYTLSESAEEGKVIEVKDSKGETVVSYTPSKSYQSFIFSSDEMKTGGTYTVYVDGEQKDEFTVSEVITNAGTASNGFGGFGGFGGGRGGRGQAMQDNIDK